MRASLTSAALCGLLLWGAAGDLQAQIARAEILEEVVIDGKLDDWPDHLEALHRHAVWGGLGQDVVEDIAEGLTAVFVILSIGAAIGLVAYIGNRGRKVPAQEPLLDELAERLEVIEQRLADTQDVMVALNEKYDRLEGNFGRPNGD